LRKAEWPDINLSPQQLISCNTENDGCHGGDKNLAHQWMEQNGIVDETCSIYRARGHDNGVPCSQELTCQNCDPEKGCFPTPSYNVYGLDQHGTVTGE